MKTTPKTKRDFTPKQMEFLKDIVAKCMTGKWESSHPQQTLEKINADEGYAALP